MLKQLFLSAATTLWTLALGAQVALAQATCTFNGQEVPCDELADKAGGLLGFGLGIFILMLIVFIIATIFWFMMLVHAIRHDIENKPLWILLIVLTGVIGALIYYFTVKREMRTPPPTQQFGATQ